MASWMDLEEIPIRPSSPDNGRHVDESLAIIEGIVGSEQSHGIPTERIVIGGFSQGGAMSLASVVQATRRLAGCCVLSGWALPRQNVGSAASKSTNMNIPFLLCHGESDGVVVVDCAYNAKELLVTAGCSDVTLRTFPGLAHASCDEEEGLVSGFLGLVLPRPPRS